MITIGTVVGSEITKNKDGDDNVRLLQVELTNADDIQTVEQMRRAGEDSNPQPGARVIVLDLAPSYRVAVAEEDGIEPTVAAGEKEFYSYDDALAKQAHIRILANGDVEINDNTDFAVRYNELETAFNDLQAELDDTITRLNAVTTLLKTWAVLPQDGGLALQSQAQADFMVDVPASAADITPAKIDNIKVPAP